MDDAAVKDVAVEDYWYVRLELDLDKDLTDDQIDDLTAALAPYSGVMSIGNPLGVAISVDSGPHAITPFEAAATGAEIVLGALGTVGGPGATVRSVETMPGDDLAASLKVPTIPELVGVSEVAELLGVSRQRAHTLAGDPRFPRPVVRLKAGPIWLRAAVERFADGWSRTSGRPRSEPAAAAG